MKTFCSKVDVQMHYDERSGAIYLPRIWKNYVDGTSYWSPNADGCASIKNGGKVLYEIKNRTLARKLLRILSDSSILQRLEL